MSTLQPPAEPPADPSLLLTKAELAAHLRCSDRQIDLLVSGKQLPAPIRVGKQPRWPRQVIVEWIAAQ